MPALLRGSLFALRTAGARRRKPIRLRVSLLFQGRLRRDALRAALARRPRASNHPNAQQSTRPGKERALDELDISTGAEWELEVVAPGARSAARSTGAGAREPWVGLLGQVAARAIAASRSGLYQTGVKP